MICPRKINDFSQIGLNRRAVSSLFAIFSTINDFSRYQMFIYRLWRFNSGSSSVWNCVKQMSTKNVIPDSSDNQSLGKLVYSAQSKKLVCRAKAFSVVSSAIGFMCQPFFIDCFNESGPMRYVFVGAFSFFIVGTPILLHQLTKSFVFELYYREREDAFTAITKNIFLMNRALHFTADDCRLKSIPIPFANVEVRGIALNFNEIDFSDVTIMKKIFGIDKPFKIR